MVDRAQDNHSNNKYLEEDEIEVRGSCRWSKEKSVGLAEFSLLCIQLRLAFRSGADADSYADIIGCEQRCIVEG